VDIISLLTVGTDILKSVIEWRKEIALKFGDVVTREKVYLINSEYVTYEIHCLTIKKSGVGGGISFLSYICNLAMFLAALSFLQ
jgi:hypothetical protein